MVNKEQDANNLEGSLNSGSADRQPTSAPQASGGEAPQMSQEEEIGFHKGALNTLVAERNELAKMFNNVEAIAQAHIKRLQELGVNVSEGKKQ